MKKDTLKILVPIVIVIFSLTILLLFPLFQDGEPIQNFSYKYNSLNSLDICNGECPQPPVPYHKLVMENENDNLQKIIDKINEKEEKLFQKSKNSPYSKYKECKDAPDDYKYRYVYSLKYDIYENDNYISITSKVDTQDFCKSVGSVTDYETYIFDKVIGKEISQKEFMKRLNLNDEDLVNAVNDHLKNFKKSDGSSYPKFKKLKEQKLFYTYSGQLKVSYFVEGERSIFVSPVQLKK